jgi:circadian clock protein KaiC
MRDIELDGERNRALYVLKSRGMAHSNQLREFLLTPQGVDLQDVYVGPEGVLTGSSRLSQEAREKADALARRQDAERKDRDRMRKREALEARIAALRKEFEVEEAEAETSSEEDVSREGVIADDREAMSRSRQADLVKDGVVASDEKEPDEEVRKKQRGPGLSVFKRSKRRTSPLRTRCGSFASTSRARRRVR